MEEHISDSKQPPLLYLEYLRTISNEYVARHMAFKTGEEDDSEME